MKKLHYAWIEQILSFDTEEERAGYIEQQQALCERKRQHPVQIIEEWNIVGGGFGLRIRKPYNSNLIATD